jgi:hypothetical protein
MRKILLFCAFVCLLLTYGDASAQNGKVTDPYYQTSDVQPLMATYEADKGSLNRSFTNSNGFGGGGGGGFGGGGNNNSTGSPERRERLKKLAADYLKQLDELPFEKMKSSSQVDYVLFKRAINNDLRTLAQEETEYKSIYKYVSFADPIYEMEKGRRRGVTQNVPDIISKLSAIQKQLDAASASLKNENGLIDMPLAIRAETTVNGLRNVLKNYYSFYNGYDPPFTKSVPAIYTPLDAALGKYATQLREKGNKATLQKDDGSGIVGNPIGKDELIRQLQYEMIPYTPEELIKIANKEFAWCDAEMLKASREMGFGDNWKAALEKVKNTYVPEGRQPEMIMGLYNESVDFLKKNDLVTVPPLAEETWRMNMMSAQQQLVSPFFLGGEQLLVAYPTFGMDSAQRAMSMRGNNPHFSRATVHHELIAGHRLQQYMNDRYKSYRNFRTPFWTEGWALYWEFILYDMKFPKSPEDRVGMLFWRMHRCARIIFSLNYHLGNWKPQQCIDFLVDRVGHERANAEGEVRRSFTGNYGPLYQLAYMTGAFQFYALKKEVVDKGKMSYKQFHDAILKENAMPVEMVRAIILNQPLKKDFVSNWRFYGELK